LLDSPKDWTQCQSPVPSSAQTCNSTKNSTLFYIFLNWFRKQQRNIYTILVVEEKIKDGISKFTHKEYLNSVIIATRKQNIHSWMPFNHFNILCMSLQNWNTLKFIPRHHFPYPNSLIPTTRRQERTWCIPTHTLHFIFMTLLFKTHKKN
jgi:hypothetical protein